MVLGIGMAPVGMASTHEGGMPNESVCDELSGKAFGLCTSYCEARDCEGYTNPDMEEPSANEKSCSNTFLKYLAVTGEVLPCIDIDGDGTPDINDGCPEDPGKITVGICGCGVADGVDVDNDQIDDCIDEQICANGVLEAPEECDDGNLINGDDCDDLCQFEIVASKVTPIITSYFEGNSQPSGYTTYQLSVTSNDPTISNIYTIYGTEASPMSLPAAYQVAAPFGANIGGTNTAFWDVANNEALGYAQFDSWLTVGITEGDSSGALGTIGIDFNAWTENNALYTDDGAIFWMNPGNGRSLLNGAEVVVAQITISSNTSFTATMGMQGRSTGELDDWSEDNVTFTYTAP